MPPYLSLIHFITHLSEKQLKANRKNAQKGGVKTPEGKAIVKYNALKHGLLAKEIKEMSNNLAF